MLCRVILCKGLDYPPVYPLPVMTTLPVSLPLCDPQTEKSEIEVSDIHCTCKAIIRIWFKKSERVKKNFFVFQRRQK